MSDKLHDLFREESIEWAGLVDMLDASPCEPLTADSWSWRSAAVYAHLARWFGHLETMLQERPARAELAALEQADVDASNSRGRSEDASLTLDVARNRALAARWRLLAVAASMPASERDTCFVDVLRRYTLDHYREHRQSIVRTPR